MRIDGSRNGIMIQRMMVQKTGGPNNINSRAKNAAYPDNGDEAARSRKSDAADGMNYNQLAAMVVQSAAPGKRQQERESGSKNENGASGRQAPRVPNDSGGGPQQAVRTGIGQTSRGESGGYNNVAQGQPDYKKGDIVNLSA